MIRHGGRSTVTDEQDGLNEEKSGLNEEKSGLNEEKSGSIVWRSHRLQTGCKEG